MPISIIIIAIGYCLFVTTANGFTVTTELISLALVLTLSLATGAFLVLREKPWVVRWCEQRRLCRAIGRLLGAKITLRRFDYRWTRAYRGRIMPIIVIIVIGYLLAAMADGFTAGWATGKLISLALVLTLSLTIGAFLFLREKPWVVRWRERRRYRKARKQEQKVRDADGPSLPSIWFLFIGPIGWVIYGVGLALFLASSTIEGAHANVEVAKLKGEYSERARMELELEAHKRAIASLERNIHSA